MLAQVTPSELVSMVKADQDVRILMDTQLGEMPITKVTSEGDLLIFTSIAKEDNNLKPVTMKTDTFLSLFRMFQINYIKTLIMLVDNNHPDPEPA